mmetsp:Transcript_2286/g.3509  ORF Transcript_2286/g.3509 Transcript_2286/m.3509 type:complete len:123 (+) Transcript_2286:90-458(+)|eukprot:CAMPEP_0185024602 /NCGR_PEP_ID=MMETSP1103-20130426/7740_1 /TAXON_ID=36769 /ORGANISM="Paraphysomonas bandaiensis, Strain Caron Lab Isolate" /LENGTH=122 /DNA_ID=CAMNT_0027557619 /DNA_START=77 /DNA_END=445 /DNA_ORIENTATION=+
MGFLASLRRFGLRYRERVKRVWFYKNWRASSLKKREARLKYYGLNADDIRIEYPHVQVALERLSPEEKLARERRILRAFDLSAKKKGMPEDQQFDPYANRYLQDLVKDAKEEQNIRKAINHY